MDEHGYHDEMPLPTYEEAVGISNYNIGFDNTGSQSDSELFIEYVSVPVDEGRSSTSRCFDQPKCWKREHLATIFVLTSPVFMFFITMQFQSCKEWCNNFKEENKTVLSIVEKCKVEKSNISERYDEIFRNLQDTKREYEELLIKKETTETEMKHLRFQYDIVTSEITDLEKLVVGFKNNIEDYKILLKNQRKDNKSPPQTFTVEPAQAKTKTNTENLLILPRNPSDAFSSISKILGYIDNHFPKPSTESPK